MEIRKFESGADRDTDERKYDYEAFLSPLVIKEFGRYMHEKRLRKDGTLRDGDNWQQGFPMASYVKSAFRHFHDWWMLHRGYETVDFDGNVVDELDALMALLFNVQGYAHELLKERQAKPKMQVADMLRQIQQVPTQVTLPSLRPTTDKLGRYCNHSVPLGAYCASCADARP